MWECSHRLLEAPNLSALLKPVFHWFSRTISGNREALLKSACPHHTQIGSWARVLAWLSHQLLSMSTASGTQPERDLQNNVPHGYMCTYVTSMTAHYWRKVLNRSQMCAYGNENHAIIIFACPQFYGNKVDLKKKKKKSIIRPRNGHDMPACLIFTVWQKGCYLCNWDSTAIPAISIAEHDSCSAGTSLSPRDITAFAGQGVLSGHENCGLRLILTIHML